MKDEIKVGDKVMIIRPGAATIPDEVKDRVGTVVENDFSKYKYKAYFGTAKTRLPFSEREAEFPLIFYFFEDELVKVNGRDSR